MSHTLKWKWILAQYLKYKQYYILEKDILEKGIIRNNL